ncbi:MAG: Gfo/Idh/MocA family oxidoreductase [Flavobacteriales bacterium]|nr:Gfo/Idh/MocA family oxidoreductase [Flavobacteriales bacterium]
MSTDYSIHNLKVVFIGCGNIAGYHFAVLDRVGVSVVGVSAKPGSLNLSRFTKKFNVRGYENNHELIEQENPDAILVLSSWEETSSIIDEIISYNIPLFIEKPVSLLSNKIEKWIKEYPEMLDKVQIGFNRRFYPFISELRNWVASKDLSSIELNIPEARQKSESEEDHDKWFFANSCHIFDLMYFLIGKKTITVEYVQRCGGGNQGLIATLKTATGVPIQLMSNWGSPSNFGIVFHANTEKLVLSPLEHAEVFNGFVVNEDKPGGMRSYTPQLKKKYQLEENGLKPGFLEQVINFIDTTVLKNKANFQGANLLDSLTVLKVMEEIVDRT